MTVLDPINKKLPVMEIFGPTVQGEGLVVGQRTLFIRFGACDYRCKMCDSMHAVDPESIQANAEWLVQDEIAQRVIELAQNTNTGWVTLSGGNPAIHDLSHLVDQLQQADLGISVETQGTFAPGWLGKCDYITVSPKGPGMGEKFERQKFVNLIQALHEHPGLSVKVVIFHAVDLEFASAIAEMVPTLVDSDRFYLSHGNPFPPKLDGSNEYLVPGKTPEDAPTWYVDPLTDSIERYKATKDELKDYPALKFARFLPQLHHWIWGNEKGR